MLIAAIAVVSFTGRSGAFPYLGGVRKGTAMNVLRKLAWAAMVVAAGVPSSRLFAPGAPAAAPAPRPAASPAPAPRPATPAAPAASEPPGGRWRWLPFAEPEDDDEFEGDGWTFWPTWGR
jgi:hypothetical protein